MLTTKDVARLRFELMAREHVQRIGARIRRRREELGLSQAAVAEEMPSPIDGNYISRWERGQHKPSDESLDRLAEILQTDRAYFLTDSLKTGTPDFLSGGREPTPSLAVEMAAIRIEIAALATQLEVLQRTLEQLPGNGSAPSRTRRAK